MGTPIVEWLPDDLPQYLFPMSQSFTKQSTSHSFRGHSGIHLSCFITRRGNKQIYLLVCEARSAWPPFLSPLDQFNVNSSKASLLQLLKLLKSFPSVFIPICSNNIARSFPCCWLRTVFFVSSFKPIISWLLNATLVKESLPAKAAKYQVLQFGLQWDTLPLLLASLVPLYLLFSLTYPIHVQLVMKWTVNL